MPLRRTHYDGDRSNAYRCIVQRYILRKSASTDPAAGDQLEPGPKRMRNPAASGTGAPLMRPG